MERWPGASVFVTSLLLAFVTTWPLILNLTGTLYAYPGDAMGTVSDFWWFDYALHHGLPLLYNSLRGVPLGSGWENVYFDVLQVGLFAPLSYVVGPIAAYNLGILVSFPLTAWLTFLLGRRLGMSGLAAAFAGFAFAFVPYHQEKAMVHLMHTHMELFSAFLYFGVRWRQTKSHWNIAAAGAISGLTLWADPTMFYVLAVLAGAFFLTSFVARPKDGSWSSQLRGHFIAGATIVIITALFLPAVLAVSSRSSSQPVGSFQGQFVSTKRLVTELDTYAARTKEYVLPWHLNPLLPKSLRDYEYANLHGSSFAEQTLTIGFTVMVFAAVGVVAFRRTYAAWLLVAVAVTGFVMTQPPERHVFGVNIPGPSHFLFHLLPIFRVYSRFAMLVLLGAALLAGLGFAALQLRLGRSRTWALAIPFVLVAVEFNSMPPSHVYQVFPAPAEYVWLKSQPAGTLIEYPIAVKSNDPTVGTEIEVQNRVYTLYQQVHEHAMFNGATANSAAGQLAYQLEPYYAVGVSDQLKALSIRYVFVHRAEYARFGRDPNQPLPGFTYSQRLDGTDIWVSSSA